MEISNYLGQGKSRQWVGMGREKCVIITSGDGVSLLKML
jgi:hypothetical protein